MTRTHPLFLSVVVAFVTACASTPPAPPPPKAAPTDAVACRQERLTLHQQFPKYPVTHIDETCEHDLAWMRTQSPAAAECTARCYTETSFEASTACLGACPKLPPRSIDDPDEGPYPSENADLDHTVRRNRWRFHQCFARAIQKDPSASGTIYLAATVAPDGTVACAPDSSDATPELTACIVGACTKLKLTPKSTGAATYRFPVSLKTAQ